MATRARARRVRGRRSRSAHRVRRRVRPAGADLVHQPGSEPARRVRRAVRPGRDRRAVQHRPVHDQDRAAAAERHRAAHPAAAPAGGGGLVDLPDEPRPGLHRRVRRGRLPRAAARRLRRAADAGRPEGRDRRRDLGRPAGGGAPVGQHPDAVVPQVAGEEGRPGHDEAGHLGPDHRRRVRQRRDGRRAGQQVRGLRRVDQRPRARAPAATSSATPTRVRMPPWTSAARPGRRRPR